MRALSLTIGIILAAAAPASAQTSIQVLGIGASEGDVNADFAKDVTSFSLGPGISIGSSLGGVDPGNQSQLFNLLRNKSIREELQLSEQQFEGAQKIMQAAQERLGTLINSQLAAQKDSGGAIRLGGTQLKELMQDNQAEAEAALEEILLPAQMKRIRQLAYQINVNQQGLGKALTEGKLGEEIGVHDDQKQNLTDRAAKIDAELRQAMLRIHAEARAKMFRELTPEQRQQAEELLGPVFLYEEPSLSQQLRESAERRQKQAPQTKD